MNNQARKEITGSAKPSPDPDVEFDDLRAITDVKEMHSLVQEFLQELGLPVDLIQEEILAFRRELTLESDRGAALYAAAHLDERLKLLMQSFLVDDESAIAPMLSGNGALATFSSRIDMAYLLGLLPPIVRRDLHLIRKIRNEFAHSAQPLTFQYPAIASRCNELNRAPLADQPRWRFIQSAMGCGGVIDGALVCLSTGKLHRCTLADDPPLADPNIVKMGMDLMARQATIKAKRSKKNLE